MKDLGYRVYNPRKRNPETLPTYGNFSKQGPPRDRRDICSDPTIFIGIPLAYAFYGEYFEKHPYPQNPPHGSTWTVRGNEQVRYSCIPGALCGGFPKFRVPF